MRGVREGVAHAQQVAVGRRQILRVTRAATSPPTEASPAMIARRRVMSADVLHVIPPRSWPGSDAGIRT